METLLCTLCSLLSIRIITAATDAPTQEPTISFNFITTDLLGTDTPTADPTTEPTSDFSMMTTDFLMSDLPTTAPTPYTTNVSNCNYSFQTKGFSDGEKNGLWIDTGSIYGSEPIYQLSSGLKFSNETTYEIIYYNDTTWVMISFPVSNTSAVRDEYVCLETELEECYEDFWFRVSNDSFDLDDGAKIYIDEEYCEYSFNT